MAQPETHKDNKDNIDEALKRSAIPDGLKLRRFPDFRRTAGDLDASYSGLLTALGSADMSGLLRHQPARDLSFVEPLQSNRGPFRGRLENRSTQYVADQDCPMLMCVRDEFSGAWTKFFSIKPSQISHYHLQLEDAQPHPSRPELHFVPMYFQVQGGEEVYSAYVLCKRQHYGLQIQEATKLKVVFDFGPTDGDPDACDPLGS